MEKHLGCFFFNRLSCPPFLGALRVHSFAGATAAGAGGCIREDPGGCGPLSDVATALLFVYVQQATRGGHPLRTLVLLGVHRGVVPDEPGVPAVQAARHAAVDRLPVPVRLRVHADGGGSPTVDSGV